MNRRRTGPNGIRTAPDELQQVVMYRQQTGDEQRKAALFVAALTLDSAEPVKDCAELLAILGLPGGAS